MTGMIGISIYILADTFFISLAQGAEGIAMLNLTLPLYGLLFAVGSMIGIGSATRYAIQSAGGAENAGNLFAHALIWQLLLGLPFVLFGIVSPQWYLKVMGGDTALVALGRDYVRIVLLAAPLFMMNYSFTAFVRNDGAPSLAMWASLAGSSFNIVFDYIFMFPLHMGLAGAALATSLSPVVTSLICSVHFVRNAEKFCAGFRRPSVRMLFSCCKYGISAFVGEISSAVTTTVFNFLLLSIAGNTGVAAYGVIANLSLVAMSVFNGLSQGMQPLLSRSYGRGDKEAERQVLIWGLAVCLVLEGVILFGAWRFTGELTGIFNSRENAQLAAYAGEGLRLYVLGFLFAGFNILFTAYFAAVGKTRESSLAAFLRGVVLITISAFVLAALWGIRGVWLSFPAAEAVTFVVVMYFFVR